MPRGYKGKAKHKVTEIKLKNKGDLIYESKLLRDKLLIQEKDEKLLTKKSLQVMTKKKPTSKQFDDMLFAFKISRYVKSNSIVFVKNNKTLAIGAGQMSRIDSTNIAFNKSKKEKYHSKAPLWHQKHSFHSEIMLIWQKK